MASVWEHKTVRLYPVDLENMQDFSYRRHPNVGHADGWRVVYAQADGESVLLLLERESDPQTAEFARAMNGEPALPFPLGVRSLHVVNPQEDHESDTEAGSGP